MRKKFTLTKKDFILIIILAITILLVDYSLKWYHVYKEHNLSTPVISQYISEVEGTEFENYIAENSNTFVYMGIVDNQKCRTFENRFKKILTKYDLRDEVVYLNAKGIDLNMFSNEYISNELRKENTLISETPAIVVYNNSKVVDFVDYKNSDMKEKSIVKFFRKYGLIEYND